ncbi:uncharacterized protein Tco025E_01101 [Trypanosoma conorhini]|uniref:Uncharacterized protein n=1 Tax=Trypanosoma conorhini TaxID=83891 RepID=A0A422Q9Q1_9TRYP|nr:uncharacterized protein Tco025E_01101 [Trypanosoma conorhini]RNF26703.1 hypothetical protein Tco025E_01101 [Trypanosoma conorhini]
MCRVLPAPMDHPYGRPHIISSHESGPVPYAMGPASHWAPVPRPPGRPVPARRFLRAPHAGSAPLVPNVQQRVMRHNMGKCTHGNVVMCMNAHNAEMNSLNRRASGYKQGNAACINRHNTDNNSSGSKAGNIPANGALCLPRRGVRITFLLSTPTPQGLENSSTGGNQYRACSDSTAQAQHDPRSDSRKAIAGDEVVVDATGIGCNISPVTGKPVVARGPQPAVVAPTRFKEHHYKRPRHRHKEDIPDPAREWWVEGLVQTRRVPSPSSSHRRSSAEGGKQKPGAGAKEAGPPVKNSKFVNAFLGLFK